MGESMANATIIIRCNDDDEGLGTTQHVGSLSQSVSVSLVVICISRKNPTFDYAVLERASTTEVSFFSESRADLDF